MQKITSNDLLAEMKVLRDNFSDPYVVKEVANGYKALNIEGRKVMDLGANIGAFTVYATMRNAKSVVSFEPEENNFKILQQNAAGRQDVLVCKSAVTMSKEKTIPFYITDGNNAGAHSTLPFNGREEVMVPNLYFLGVLSKYKPQVIKMDIEGEEHLLLSRPLPGYVKEIIVEIHFNKRMFRESWEDWLKNFSKWECVKVPRNTGKNWHTIGHWRRG